MCTNGLRLNPAFPAASLPFHPVSLIGAHEVFPPIFSGACSLGLAEESWLHMSMNVDWRELYHAAMLELRPEDLRLRIDDAEKAIQQRIAELRQDDSNSGEESRALDDALRGLRVVAGMECRSAQSTLSGLGQDEAT